MPPYQRDPLSEWFDHVAVDWLQRAYRHAGSWEGVYFAPPTKARRQQALHELGIADLAAKDRWGLDRWTRAFKRAVYRNHKLYGYAGELRPGDPRADDSAATALRWELGGLVRKAGWPTRRREIRIMIVTDADAALTAVRARPAGKRWDLDDSYRSKPGPPDRPWG